LGTAAKEGEVVEGARGAVPHPPPVSPGAVAGKGPAFAGEPTVGALSAAAVVEDLGCAAAASAAAGAALLVSTHPTPGGRPRFLGGCCITPSSLNALPPPAAKALPAVVPGTAPAGFDTTSSAADMPAAAAAAALSAVVVLPADPPAPARFDALGGGV